MLLCTYMRWKNIGGQKKSLKIKIYVDSVIIVGDSMFFLLTAPTFSLCGLIALQVHINALHFAFVYRRICPGFPLVYAFSVSFLTLPACLSMMWCFPNCLFFLPGPHFNLGYRGRR